MPERKIDIRPGISVLSALRHLNYRPWYALGEFVDNAVQSYLQNQSALKSAEGDDFKLRVEIELDANSSRIGIRDNAAGIFESEYGRAFRPAAIPLDRTGLAEFGMGMKSAACWFAPYWSVRTSALGEPVAREVRFDIERIVDDNIEELTIHETDEKPHWHYTDIQLEEVFHFPAGRTIGKLKEHLADIYREFVRNGTLDLSFNGELLKFSEPRILRAAYFKDKEGNEVEWKKSIDFDFGQGLSIKGFAAIREKANTKRAGFSLFRRNRVIQGSGDEGYRPNYIFGRSNSYRFQRLFGELHLHGFEVSHTKDGFRWDENEQPFLELLREHLDSDELPLLKQAEGYRVRASRAKLKHLATEALDNTATVLEKKLPPVIPEITDAKPIDTSSELTPSISVLADRNFDIIFRDRQWIINVELTDNPAENQWLSVQDNNDVQPREQPRVIYIRVSMVHPFMVQYAQKDSEAIESLLRVAAAIAVAEIIARDTGVRKSGTVRRNVNEILRNALSDA